MVKIRRAPVPSELQNINSNVIQYKNRNVVNILWKMQHEKCCYCERKIPDEGASKTVEHFKPRSIFNELINNWNNLLLACPLCNEKKGNKFPVFSFENDDVVTYLQIASNDTPAIIDPSDPNIDPEDHITFDFTRSETDDEFGIISTKNNSKLGHYTIQTINLDNLYYTKIRNNHYIDIILPQYINLLRAKAQQNDDSIKICKNSFRQFMSSKNEFSAFVRAFVKYKRLDKPPVEIQIPRGTEI